MSRLAVPALLAALLLPASAYGGSAGKRIRASVDASAYPTVRLTIVTPEPLRTPPTLTEGGVPAAGLRTENLDRAKSIVLAVDRSQSMRGKPLRLALAAAEQFVATKPRTDRFAISAFATEAAMLTGFSDATAESGTALASIHVDPVRGTRLYDDLVLAVRSLAGEPNPGVVIAVTDGNETQSQATLEDVVTAARAANVSIYVIAIESSRFTPMPLETIAAQTGGGYVGTASPEALASVYAAIGNELRRRWQLEYVTGARPGESRRLVVGVPGQGSVTLRLDVPVGAGSTGSGLASKPWGVAALGFVVGLLVLLAVGLVGKKDKRERLRAQLAPHVGRKAGGRQKRKRTLSERLSLLSIVFRTTEVVFGRTRQWLKVQRLLVRADVPLKTAEFVYVVIGSSMVLGLLCTVAGAGRLIIAFFLVLGGLAPVGIVWIKARRRVAAFDGQLSDLLISIAASLKAGHSFKQALQSLAEDAAEPARKELTRTLAEAQLGRPIEHALEEMADRLGSKDFAFVVTTVKIQNQVGGSLAGLFDMVAETVRNRQQFARRIKSLTAMGRMSAYVLIGMPIFIVAAISLISPAFMSPLLHTSPGQKMIALALTMMSIGSVVLKKMVSFRG